MSWSFVGKKKTWPASVCWALSVPSPSLMALAAASLKLYGGMDAPLCLPEAGIDVNLLGE